MVAFASTYEDGGDDFSFESCSDDGETSVRDTPEPADGNDGAETFSVRSVAVAVSVRC